MNLFRLCVASGVKAGVIQYIATTVSFGTSSPSNFNPTCPVSRTYPPRGIVDVLVFLIIAIRAKRHGTHRYRGIPSLWKVILRDATLYFMTLMFVQLLSVIFLFGAPVGDTWCVRGWFGLFSL